MDVEVVEQRREVRFLGQDIADLDREFLLRAALLPIS